MQPALRCIKNAFIPVFMTETKEGLSNTLVCLLCSQLLYTFDKQVCVSSCSLNKEETLLGKNAADTFIIVLVVVFNFVHHYDLLVLRRWLLMWASFVLAVSLSQSTQGEGRFKPGTEHYL